MNRRNAVKNLLIGSGGLITLPFWMEACGISDKNTHQSSFSVAEQHMLSSITDTIIPAGNSVGALVVGVDKYLQKLLDDCYEKPVQENVKRQIQSLDTSAKTMYAKSFAACDQPQRQALLLKYSVSLNKEEKDFFELMKTETIRGFNTSQKVMEEFLGYKVAPGHYYGCVNVKT
ncbi:MAG TPA: gluconate 2-dehydrogenase subunit 3 family protein [Puia sp.]|jgi:hypothetical protein|nr:gluconate 2-dehydrogenase subunit 3 family protein [Puia sp.]